MSQLPLYLELAHAAFPSSVGHKASAALRYAATRALLYGSRLSEHKYADMFEQNVWRALAAHRTADLALGVALFARVSLLQASDHVDNPLTSMIAGANTPRHRSVQAEPPARFVDINILACVEDNLRATEVPLDTAYLFWAKIVYLLYSYERHSLAADPTLSSVRLKLPKMAEGLSAVDVVRFIIDPPSNLV